MRRASRLAVPGAGASVHQLLILFVPGPRLHQGVHPQVQVEAALAAVDVPHLLLARTPHLFHVLVHLLVRLPGPRFSAGFAGSSGNDHKAASLRRRLMTVKPSALAPFKKTFLAYPPSTTTQSCSKRWPTQLSAQSN